MAEQAEHGARLSRDTRRETVLVELVSVGSVAGKHCLNRLIAEGFALDAVWFLRLSAAKRSREIIKSSTRCPRRLRA